MYHLKMLFGRMDEGTVGPSSFQAGEAVENDEDEKLIIGDQDETGTGRVNAEDEVMGGMGTTDEFGLESAEFARGEIDLKEQMERTTRAMDRATHRMDIEPAATPDPEGRVDVDEAVSDSLNNRKPGEDEKAMHTRHGHSTGAYTDVGAGRSGVTRVHDAGKTTKH